VEIIQSGTMIIIGIKISKNTHWKLNYYRRPLFFHTKFWRSIIVLLSFTKRFSIIHGLENGYNVIYGLNFVIFKQPEVEQSNVVNQPIPTSIGPSQLYCHPPLLASWQCTWGKGTSMCCVAWVYPHFINLVPTNFEKSQKIHFLLKCLDSTCKRLLSNFSTSEKYMRWQIASSRYLQYSR